MQWQGHSRWFLAALSLLAGTAGCQYFPAVGRARLVQERTYRIGWEIDPPFQDRAADGSPAGVALELVREAARKRGIHLQWIYHPGSSEAALRSGAVDLWPLITVLPERKGVIYISKPYLTHDSVLLVRADSSYFRPEDLASAAISYYDLPVNLRLLHTLLPSANGIPALSQQDLLQNLCTHRVEAAYLDEFSANAALLSGLGCSDRLRTIPLPTMRTQLGVGSTFAASRAADEIRKGIDEVAAEGGLDRILAAWGGLSARNLTYFDSLADAQRREPWLVAALALFAVLLAVTIAGGTRIRRQRDRIARAERAHRESEQKLRLLANNLTEMVLVYDMQRRLVFANAAAVTITGRSMAELESGNPACWVDPADRDRVLEKWNKLFEGGAYRDLEYRLESKDRTKWVTATWGPLFGEGGVQIGVHGSERDITASRIAEQALRESERQFRGLLEGVQLAAVIVDLAGCIRFCNDFTCNLTEWSREEIIGRPGAEYLGADCLRQLHQRVDAAPPAPLVECGIRTRSGRLRRIQWNAAQLRDAAGRPAGIACLGADVTELEILRTEAARRRSEEEFRIIADTAPLMIWMAGTDRGHTFVNKGWLAFTGRSLHDELGMGWTATIHPADLPGCLESYCSAFEERRSFHIHFRRRRHDGDYRWLLASGAPNLGSQGELLGYVGTCVDVTDLKRAESENIARQKLESVASLARGIAHDFNNLLAAVLAQADLAASEIAEGLSPSESLKNIRTVANRGAGIVRQLMIYAGQEKVGSEPLDISREVEEMVDLLRVVVSKTVTLNTELAKDLPLVDANPAQIRLILMNLVLNASEAIGPREGGIVVRTAQAAAAPDGSGHSLVQLQISDTGCGMAPDMLERIFDPFFTTKSPGHGLGLSIVQGVIRTLDGALEVESDPASGTTVRISLPATVKAAVSQSTTPAARQSATFAIPQIAAPAAPRSITPAAERRSPPGYVLIVDDERSLRIASSAMLRRRGYSVLDAADGTEAIDLIGKYKDEISLVLLDMALPGVPSRDVCAEARRLRSDVKVIVCSGFARNALAASLTEMRADSFLRKPYQFAELHDLIRNLLSA